MNKIITVTLNPAIDRITEVADFHVGDVQKAPAAHVYPAGKGVNVARALSCMGKDVTAIALLGAESASFFNSIKDICTLDSDFSYGRITTEWILTNTPTRTNNTFIDPIRSTETHIREVVDIKEPFPKEEVSKAISKHCQSGDVLVFAGSLPTNAIGEDLADLVRFYRQKGAKVVVDTSGPALNSAIQASPTLIKPNLSELQELVGHKFYTKSEIIAAAREISLTHNIPYVVVSMGEEGAIMVADKAYDAMFMLRLSQNQLHAVGCGDTMVAALAEQLLVNASPEDMLKHGTAAGVVNLMTEGPGLISAEKMRRVLDAVEISEILN